MNDREIVSLMKQAARNESDYYKDVYDENEAGDKKDNPQEQANNVAMFCLEFKEKMEGKFKSDEIVKLLQSILQNIS